MRTRVEPQYNKVTRIDVIFGRGSMQQWAEEDGAEYTDEQIALWENAYNAECKAELASDFMRAEIEVGEGWDQYPATKINFDYAPGYDSSDDSWLRQTLEEAAIEQRIADVLLFVAERGAFWDAGL